MKEIVSREFTERVFNKDKKYISIPKLLKEFNFDRKYIVENFANCKKACGKIMDYVVFSFEELDLILENYTFTSADWIRIFERETIPHWFLRKHIKKLEVKNIHNRRWHTKTRFLVIKHQLPLDILDENVFIIGLRYIYMYQMVSKDFIIKHLPNLLIEIKDLHLQNSIDWAVWKDLVSLKSINRDIIEDNLELYLDPEGRSKYDTIKIKVD